MAVITRFIVVRNGVELDKEFDVKKEADAYDKIRVKMYLTGI